MLLLWSNTTSSNATSPNSRTNAGGATMFKIRPYVGVGIPGMSPAGARENV